MSQIEDAMDGLMTAIRNSEEFIRYQAIKEKVHAFQNWKARSQNFVRKIICCRTVRELWICMKRQTAWRMSTGSFGRSYGVRVSCSRKCTLQNCAADQLDFDRGTGI